VGSSTSSAQPIETIFFNRSRGVFQCGAQALRGIHLTIGTLFWPGFDFKQEFYGHNRDTKVEVSSSATHERSRARSNSQPGAATRKRKSSRSRRRFIPIWKIEKKHKACATAKPLSPGSSHDAQIEGQLLDSQIAFAVVLLKSNKYSFRDLAEACSDTTTMSTSGAAGARVHACKWSAATRSLVWFLFLKGWLPTNAQLDVGSKKHYVATRLDLVCWDTVGKRRLIIENKVGYEYGECGKSYGPMRAPFKAFDARLDNQHKVQALAGQVLFEKTYPTIAETDRIDAVVLKISANGAGVEEMPVGEDMAKLKDELWRAIVRSAS
jgi:hypothetical protein